jgi:hypothetical protein
MPSGISYSLSVGGNLETVTAGTLAPSAGQLEIRIDSSSSVTDGGSTRAAKKGEIQALMRVLEQYLIRDTNVFE